MLEGLFKKIALMMIVILLPALAAGPALCGPAEDAGPRAKEESKEELAKKVQNPVSDLVSIPYQSNFNYNYGPHNGNQYVGNLQPVVPFSASQDWNVITRTIVPVVRQPELAPNVGDVWGLGDIQFTAFLSPVKSAGIIWGAGPMFQFPSGTDTSVTAGKYAAGPSAVVVRMDGHWVYGVLSNYISSFAGQSDHGAVSLWTTQPFINYNLPDGWYLVTSPIITDNLMAGSGQRWTVPVGGGVGKIIKFGKLPVSMSLQGFYNVEHPDIGPEWSVRFQIQVLLPKSIF